MWPAFMNEDEVPVCLKSGDAPCLNQRSQLWDDMFGFSQQLNRRSEGWTPGIPRLHRSEWGVTLTAVNGL